MQDEHGRIWSHFIDLLQRGHAAFGKLELAPAAYHAHPLAGRGSSGLFLEHAEGVRQGGNAVPAQFHVVIKAAADDVEVGIVQAGNDRSLSGVYGLGIRSLVFGDVFVGTDSQNFSILHGNGLGHGAAFIQRRYFAV